MTSRLFINVQDVQQLYGRSYSHAWRMLQTIKDALAKEKHQNITIFELAQYEGIPIEQIKTTLKIK